MRLFFRNKRRTFLYGFLFLLAFNLIGNVSGFFLARLERSARKYKRQWIMNKYPNVLTYPSAMDTLYEPYGISSGSSDKLGESFLKVDRQLKGGVSRLLIIRALEKVRRIGKPAID